MANKVIALFAEGKTEIEFYKAVIKKARELMGIPYDCLIEYFDMHGIGKYKSKALAKFNFLKKKHPEKSIHAYLCIDEDVFALSKKPPFNKKEVTESLKNAGAKKAACIVAAQSIEEWFLCDFAGVLNYLDLPENTKRPSGSGQESLKALFKKANKLYLKGNATEGFIEKLDISKIMKTCCPHLKPLCNELGLVCEKVCGERK